MAWTLSLIWGFSFICSDDYQCRDLGSAGSPLSLDDPTLDVCSDGQCLLACGGLQACRDSTFGCPDGSV